MYNDQFESAGSGWKPSGHDVVAEVAKTSEVFPGWSKVFTNSTTQSPVNSGSKNSSGCWGSAVKGSFLLLICLLVGQADLAVAQRGRLPDFDYYTNFANFFQGDYKSALRRFERGAATAYQRGSTRFLDSMCYWTMMAECHYHVGNYSAAIELYERSLGLYLTYSELRWQQRLRPPQQFGELVNAVQRARINWFRSKRRFRIARMPDEFQILFGRFDAARVFEEGGDFNPAEFRSVDVTEIMRCASLALHRRRTIKGPTCKYDPFTTRLVNGLSGHGSNDGTLIGAYNGVLLGIAEASQENYVKAAGRLKKALQFGAGFDHPLTPVALLELAQIGAATGKDAAAETLCLEASHSAAIFDQYDMIEESLGLATMLHLKQSRTPYPPLRNAIAWVAPIKARKLHGSLLVRLAECLAEAGDVAGATAALKETNRVITSRSALSSTVAGSRARYVAAMIHLLAGDAAGGESELKAALASFRNGSKGLYQLSLADNLTVSGAVTDRQADLLYSAVLHDPTADEWLLDPFETLANFVAPKVGTLSRWFEIVLARKDYSKALYVAEKLRRARFYSELPFGGRLLSFRWMLHGPDQALTSDALQQRKDFLVRHPNYLQISRDLQQVDQDLRRLPILPDPKSDQWKSQQRLFEALGELKSARNGYLSAVSLRREPADLAFPPLRPMKEFGKSIQPGQMALVTVEAGDGYHLFLVDASGIRYLNQLRSRDVLRLAGGLIKTLNLADPVVKPEDLADKKWHDAALKLKQLLLTGLSDDELVSVQDLVIVPDGLLWYVPFEIFPVGQPDADGNTPRLGDRLPLRYSPTMFLAFGAQRPVDTQNAVSKRSALLSGRMQMRGDADWVQQEVQELTRLSPDVEPVSSIRIPANLLASTTDQWLVWSDLRTGKDRPLSLVPLPVGKVSASQDFQQQSIGSWLRLPVSAPGNVLLPGYESDAGSAFRSRSNGSDLFLTTCTMLASGCDRLLISRWNTGGETELRLARDYYERSKTVRPAVALLESRLAIREHELDPAKQPRLKFKAGDPRFKATHPAYWANSIVVDVPRLPPQPITVPPGAANPAVAPGPGAAMVPAAPADPEVAVPDAALSQDGDAVGESPDPSDLDLEADPDVDEEAADADAVK